MILSKKITRSEAVIRIRYCDNASAEAVRKAISPDNLNTEGMFIDATSCKGILEIRVVCGRSVGSFVATLDDILSCISAAEKALGGIT